MSGVFVHTNFTHFMTYTINILGLTLKRLLARVVPLLVLRIDLQFPLAAMWVKSQCFEFIPERQTRSPQTRNGHELHLCTS